VAAIEFTDIKNLGDISERPGFHLQRGRHHQGTWWLPGLIFDLSHDPRKFCNPLLFLHSVLARLMK